MFKTSDQIFPASPRGSGVEESRVFIPFDSNPEVETLPPVSQLLRMDVLEALGRESTQLCLAIGKRMFFFQKIQRSNEGFGVPGALLKRPLPTRPGSTGAPAVLEAFGKGGGSGAAKMRRQN